MRRVTVLLLALGMFLDKPDQPLQTKTPEFFLRKTLMRTGVHGQIWAAAITFRQLRVLTVMALI